MHEIAFGIGLFILALIMVLRIRKHSQGSAAPQLISADETHSDADVMELSNFGTPRSDESRTNADVMEGNDKTVNEEPVDNVDIINVLDHQPKPFEPVLGYMTGIPGMTL